MRIVLVLVFVALLSLQPAHADPPEPPLKLAQSVNAWAASTPVLYVSTARWHAAVPKPARRQRPVDTAQLGGSRWDSVAACESGGRWDYSGSSGFEGGLQFLHSTWVAYGGREFAEHAYDASREQQIAIAERVLAGQGWGAWPVCGRR